MLVTMASMVTACGEPSSREPLRVFAAASLTDVMADVEEAFEERHPEVDVQVALAGTQVIRLQVEQGAPADVVLAADPIHMQALVEQGLVLDRGVFAQNELVLIVPESGAIQTFADLPLAQRLVVGAPTSPIGRYTEAALERAGQRRGADFQEAVERRIVSRESNVRLVRTKVMLGEADAALVYRTDALGIDGLRVIALDPGLSEPAVLPAGRVVASAHAESAEAFLAWLTGPQGQQALVRRGFLVP